ncbi:hypothetical protein VA603_04185 [Stenotrophomonas sp. MH1]|uniref:Uncharacterized protein n=1 Tax=Stenotrophomonas capsici TaxID=3110230 RepID=A0ABU5V058_9GAMM|nr:MULTISPECIES: hypothetical protein [unclassified Stenotrophomonas]MEA5666733.1 hypothetical protein [Stenotrophomonas sp. MH1]
MRTINELTEEVRRGAYAESVRIDDLSFDGAMNAIGRLNGLDRTLVCIVVSDGNILVGGGCDGYVVTMDFLDKVVNIVDPGRDVDDFTEVTVGGQAVDYPSTYVVPLQAVDLALREFLLGDESNVPCEVIKK